jgi:predicted Zn-dependent protease
MDDFPGGVFSDDVNGGRAGARVRPGWAGVEAQTPDGQRFTVPYETCVLERGGASGHMVFCHTPDRRLTVFCEDPGFPAALARHGGGRVAGELARLAAETRRDRRRTWSLVAVGLVACALLAWGGLLLLQVGAGAAVHALPVSVDQKVGELAMQVSKLEGPKVHDPVLTQAVNLMVSRLAPHASHPGLDFQVTVVDAPVVNAFCLPGGRMVVHTGLLAAADKPDQVAGVVAHEMAHATLRHGMERVVQSAGAVVAINVLLGDVGGLVALGAEIARHGLLTRYGREQETAADLEGARMMLEAGLDPTALADFFAVLEKQQGDVPDALSWLSSHPQLSQRQETLRNLARGQRPQEPRPLDLDWDAVRRHARDPSTGADVTPAP